MNKAFRKSREKICSEEGKSFTIHHTLKRDPMEENLVLLDDSSARRGNRPATKVSLEAIKRS